MFVGEPLDRKLLSHWLQIRLLTISQVTNMILTSEAVTVWQLYSHCSSAFVQIFSKHANARGRQLNHCLTDFLIEMDNKGRVQMKNAVTGKLVCFNKRGRISIRNNTADEKCLFHERLTASGYTMLESAWKQNFFLGFNRCMSIR
ncbi:unnamed protein product [Thelazia callipaeda]|uniref:Signal transduction protein n=1 Tax=Thelazia callipaeda TaxID=103827 RepID=A0A0N5D7C0_THECL|nr:unnamed protein product [Thelazia callipaeda]